MKKILPIIVLILLIGVNLLFEFINSDFSADPNDDKLVKQKNKYQLETDDNKFQTINNCFDNLLSVVDNNDKDAVNYILTNQDNELFQIENFSIQEIYKYEKDKKGIFYAKIYVLKNNILDTKYYTFKIDYENFSYSISNSSKDKYEAAKKNKEPKNIDFTIENNDYNYLQYNDNSLDIAKRYLNDFYIKYNYSKNEAQKILVSSQKIDNFENEELENIILTKKDVNNKNLVYSVATNLHVFKIIVYSTMDYEISIK